MVKMRMSIMIVPHNAKRPIQFQINTVLLSFLVLLVFFVGGSFFFFASRYAGTTHLAYQREQKLEQAEANVDKILGELSEFVQTSKLFQNTLSSVLQQAGEKPQGNKTSLLTSKGDLAFIGDMRKTIASEPAEVQSLRNISRQLRSSIGSLEDIGTVLRSQKELLLSIPNRWPLARGYGRVTMEFGPNIHPITGQWYLHKGFDIAGIPGTRILASAEGKVIKAAYDPSYGLNIWIQHLYGFKTHYSHLRRLFVSEGQFVKQGQRIGELGNTGITTGPHLDFQILIGTDVVDPAVFLNISNNFRRWTGNR